MALAINNFLQTSSRFHIAASITSGVAALEMAVRAIGDLGKMMHSSDETVSYNFSANLGGALFYGASAINIVPGAAKIGAFVFTVYSLFADTTKKDAYFSSKTIHWIVLDSLSTIWNVVTKIFSYIPIPKHPIWLGVALLAIAAGTYHGAIPATTNFFKRLIS